MNATISLDLEMKDLSSFTLLIDTKKGFGDQLLTNNKERIANSVLQQLNELLKQNNVTGLELDIANISGGCVKIEFWPIIKTTVGGAITLGAFALYLDSLELGDAGVYLQETTRQVLQPVEPTYSIHKATLLPSDYIVQKGDTLFEIAKRIRGTFNNSGGVPSINQIAVILYFHNKHAFPTKNINHILANKKLLLPSTAKYYSKEYSDEIVRLMMAQKPFENLLIASKASPKKSG